MNLRNVFLHGDEGWGKVGERIGKHLRLERLSVCSLKDQVVRETMDSPYIENHVNMVLARSSPKEMLCLAEEDESLVFARSKAASSPPASFKVEG